MVRCFSMSARSTGSAGKRMTTDSATPTVWPSPGEIVLSASTDDESVE